MFSITQVFNDLKINYGTITGIGQPRTRSNGINSEAALCRNFLFATAPGAELCGIINEEKFLFKLVGITTFQRPTGLASNVFLM